jgi:RNA polymerase sigma-70 factor (ECF subfamily)
MVCRATRRNSIDADADFDALFSRYEQPVCSYLARLTGSVSRAQELTQETFLRAYRALLRGEQWGNPQAWLYRVASRLATDDYRRRRLLRWLPLSGQEASPAVEPAAVEHAAVQSALEALPLQYRAPLVLHCCSGYSVAEVAEALGLSTGAVEMRLYRAREMFRQAYRPEEE